MKITIKDCHVQTFRAGGKGGQNQNKRDTGVRVIHIASGARGESREARGQLENKRIAFRRMAESLVFRNWISLQFQEENEFTSRSEERIRSYNLIDRRIVDHRTGVKSSAVEDVLDGNLDILKPH